MPAGADANEELKLQDVNSLRADQNGRLDLMIFNRRMMIAGGAAMLVTPCTVRASRLEPVGIVTSLLGNAQAQRGTEVRVLEPQKSVYVGDRVSTGAAARARFALGKATELRLGERAQVRIDRFLVNAGGLIELESGGLFLDRDPARSGGQVDIRSLHGLIAVRGTQVFVGPSNGVFGVFVQSGLVTVSGAGRTVTVRAGQGTDIARPGAEPTDPRPWSVARIEFALASVH